MIGYPCKSISSQNNSPASFLDGKSLTGLGYRSLLSFVDYSRPEIVIGENVRSLASRRRQFKDEVPIDIQNRAFAGRGYNQWNKVVTSSDFGLAQSRTRCWVMYLKFFKDKLLKGNSGNFVWEHCVGQMLPMFGRSVFSCCLHCWSWFGYGQSISDSVNLSQCTCIFRRQGAVRQKCLLRRIERSVTVPL